MSDRRHSCSPGRLAFVPIATIRTYVIGASPIGSSLTRFSVPLHLKPLFPTELLVCMLPPGYAAERQKKEVSLMDWVYCRPNPYLAGRTGRLATLICPPTISACSS